MTKDDKAKIASAFQSYNLASTQCSNVLYNLSQTIENQEVRSQYGQLVRNHDAARNSMFQTLKQFGLIKG